MRHWHVSGFRELSFQNIDEELWDPGHKYTAPEGEIHVAIENEKVIRMIAYHRHSDERCEMKCLYVKPETRGMHLGDSKKHPDVRCGVDLKILRE